MSEYQLPEPPERHDTALDGPLRGWSPVFTQGDIVDYGIKCGEVGYQAGTASRDAEIFNLQQELQIECASNAIKDAEIEALRADAERYRWMRDHPTHEVKRNSRGAFAFGPIFTNYEYATFKTLDAAIDAAIAAQGDKT